MYYRCAAYSSYCVHSIILVCVAPHCVHPLYISILAHITSSTMRRHHIHCSPIALEQQQQFCHTPICHASLLRPGVTSRSFHKYKVPPASVNWGRSYMLVDTFGVIHDQLM